MSLSTFFDKLRYSEFYFHHTGFGQNLLLTHADKGDPEFRGAWAVSSESTQKFTNIHAGRNAFCVRLLDGDNPSEDHDEFIDERTLPDDGEDQEERFVVLAFDHHHLMRRNRVDLFISPGSDQSHIHARLTASRKLTGEQSETLFEGEVALFDESREHPFVMATPSA